MVGRAFSRLFVALFFRYRCFGVTNVPPSGGVLLASNHQSFLDPLLVGVAVSRQVHFMARHSLFRNAWFGGLIKELHAFPVRRGEVDIAAIREAVRILKAGKALMMFPEGTRTRDGSIGEIHSGVAIVSQRAGVPVVPVVVDGAYQAWPRHRKVFRPHPIKVAYGKPIHCTARDGASRAAFGRQIRDAMEDLQRRLRS